MLRVTKSNPCPICNRPDWCLIAADGSAAICQRVQDGSVKRAGDAGWLHVLTEDIARRFEARSRRPRRSERKRHVGSKVDFVKLSREYRQRISRRQVDMLAKSLGVTAASLVRLGVGWDGEAFCFPMSDESSRVIGIRRRFGNGRKLCVTGSSNGEGTRTLNLRIDSPIHPLTSPYTIGLYSRYFCPMQENSRWIVDG